MTPSRFKGRKNRHKSAARTPQAGTILRASITREQLLFLDEMKLAILDCEIASDGEIGDRYRAIGNMLHANVTRLDLDERTVQLLDFAHRLAAEVGSPELRLLFFRSANCWEYHWHTQSPWLYKKLDGANQPNADEWQLRGIEDQKIAMVNRAIAVWERDAELQAGARALRAYQDGHSLLPKKFSEDDFDI